MPEAFHQNMATPVTMTPVRVFFMVKETLRTSDQSVPFASVLEGLVYPPAIAWADYLFDERWATSRPDGTGRVIKKYGPVTSLRRGNIKPELGAGPSQFYTWDNTGGTANGLAEWYLMTHLTELKVYESLGRLCARESKKMECLL